MCAAIAALLYVRLGLPIYASMAINGSMCGQPINASMAINRSRCELPIYASMAMRCELPIYASMAMRCELPIYASMALMGVCVDYPYMGINRNTRGLPIGI